LSASAELLANFVKHVIIVDMGCICFSSAHTFCVEQHSAAALEEVLKEASGQPSARIVAAS